MKSYALLIVIALNVTCVAPVAAKPPIVTDDPPQKVESQRSEFELQLDAQLTRVVTVSNANPSEYRALLQAIITQVDERFPRQNSAHYFSVQTHGEEEQVRRILHVMQPIFLPRAYGTAYALLGLSYLGEGNIPVARRYAAQALTLAPYNSARAYSRGKVELAAGYPAASEEFFTLAVQYAGMRADDNSQPLVMQIDRAMGYEGLAEAYLMRGDRKRAIELLHKATAAYPASRTAPARLKELQNTSP